MKNLQNNFTTPEQSKRLLELGLPAESADGYWHFIRRSKNAILRTELRWLEPPYLNKYTAFVDMAVGTDKYRENRLKTYLPCWSVGRLIEIYFICSFQPEILIDYTIDDLIDYLVSLFESVAMDFSKLED